MTTSTRLGGVHTVKVDLEFGNVGPILEGLSDSESTL
jgi:hypothetical protein